MVQEFKEVPLVFQIALMFATILLLASLAGKR
jgi:hypothetical protein